MSSFLTGVDEGRLVEFGCWSAILSCAFNCYRPEVRVAGNIWHIEYDGSGHL